MVKNTKYDCSYEIYRSVEEEILIAIENNILPSIQRTIHENLDWRLDDMFFILVKNELIDKLEKATRE